jgi:hypothetical protein
MALEWITGQKSDNAKAAEEADRIARKRREEGLSGGVHVKDGKLVDEWGYPVSDEASVQEFGKSAAEMVAQLTNTQNVHDGVPGATPVPTNPNAPVADTIADLEQAVAPTAPRGPRPIDLTTAPKATVGTSALTGRSSMTGRTGYTSPVDRGLVDADQFRDLEIIAGQNSGQGDGNPYTAPGSEAPKVDTKAVNGVLNDVDAIRSYLFGLAGQQKNFSVAEAQLRNAGVAAERSALGQARSGNRRDRSMLERQAIAEGASIQQGVARDAALLRAQEEDQNRRFSADAAAKAAELGLNESAYLVDIGKADLDSATNWINQEFNQLGLDKQLSVQQMGQLLQFTQAMAGVQFDYDKMSVDDQNEADALLMQKYGIDQGTMVALKQLKEQGEFKWDQFFTTLVSGGIQGGTMALGNKLF